ELEFICKDGRRVPLEVSSRLIVRDGRPVGIQGIARDITERRRAEEERQRLLAREQGAVRQLSLLGEASGGLAGRLEPPPVLRASRALSPRLIAAAAYAVWRVRPESGHWEIGAAAGLSEAYVRDAGRVTGPGPVPDQPVVAEDIEHLPSLEARRAAYRA